MTEQETINIKEIISRYRNWITAGTWASEYWKNKGHWKSEIEQKIKELEQKINPNLCKNLIGD